MPLTAEPSSQKTLTVPLRNNHNAALTVMARAQVQPGGSVGEKVLTLQPAASADFPMLLTMPSAAGGANAVLEVQAKLATAPDVPGSWSVQIASQTVDTVTVAFAPPAGGVIGIGTVTWS